MASPTVAASLSKATYQPGEVMTLTVTYGDADTKAMTVSVVVTDSQGNASAPTTVTAVIDPLVTTVTDSANRTWTRVSDSGSVAVYQAAA